jgi:ParB family chromosome partitioning protein
VGANVRRDVRLDKGFVASIRERRVLEPIVCSRNGEGALVVKYGQRGPLALEAGRPTVPVVVVASAEEQDRVIDQYPENTHRADGGRAGCWRDAGGPGCRRPGGERTAEVV